MPPKVEIWSAVEEKLIQAVKERRMLWDISSAEYRSTPLKSATWEEVANTLGPQFTSEMVQRRFLHMRQTFMANLRRVRESKRSGKGADEVYKPKWQLFGRLQFLTGNCAQATSSSNFILPEKEMGMIVEDLVVFDSSFTTQPITLEISPHSLTSSPTNPPSSPGSISSCSFSNSSLTLLPPNRSSILSPGSNSGSTNLFAKRGTKRKSKGMSPSFEGAIETVKEVLSPPIAAPEVDACQHFGNFVASRLREMDSVKRRKCEDDIMRALLLN